MNFETDSLMNQWVQMFDPEDRLAAAVIYEEKPILLIRMQPEYYRSMRTFKSEDAEFFVMTEEFGEECILESGVSLDDAIGFCLLFGFEYKVQL